MNMTRVLLLLLLLLTRSVAVRRRTHLSLPLRNLAGQHFDSRAASVHGHAWTFILGESTRLASPTSRGVSIRLLEL